MRGGKRDGAGAKPTIEHKALNFKVPKPIVDEVIQFCSDYESKHDQHISKVKGFWLIWCEKTKNDGPLTPIEEACLRGKIEQFEMEIVERDSKIEELTKNYSKLQEKYSALKTKHQAKK